MRRILITGANRGIGLELTKQYLAQPDVQIFATARQPDAANALQAHQSDRLHILQLDVTDADQIAAMVQQVASTTDGLDMLINNAGVLIDRGSDLDSISAEMMMRTLEVNTVAPLMVTQALAPLLRKGQAPCVVNISSQLGALSSKTSGGLYAYCTSKAGLNMVTRGLAGDFKSDGVTVITLHPGWVQTEMGGQSASITPQDSAAGIIQVIDNLSLADTGVFYRWDGSIHPW
jgi:NAD(P)-dependent dehydrogenase (short-subunit alcohol dehydrogenase family)